MLPIMPNSGLARSSKFVTEEWATYFGNGRADVDGGWRGILYANLTLIDPVSSYAFFSDPGFDTQYLDGGASRTWYLAFAAALGGVS
jgi:endo-1,3(4)-beta-glucanase